MFIFSKKTFFEFEIQRQFTTSTFSLGRTHVIYKKDRVLNGIEPKMVSSIKFRENFSSKIEEWNHLVRRIEKIPNAKSIIEKYIKLTDKDRVTIDQIISRLSEM
nr:hypothetical protein [Leptospira borgpetersenii]